MHFCMILYFKLFNNVMFSQSNKLLNQLIAIDMLEIHLDRNMIIGCTVDSGTKIWANYHVMLAQAMHLIPDYISLVARTCIQASPKKCNPPLFSVYFQNRKISCLACRQIFSGFNIAFKSNNKY